MNPNFAAVDAFVPLWIFVPLLLVGVVGLLSTPKSKRGSSDASDAHDRSQSDMSIRQATGRTSLER